MSSTLYARGIYQDPRRMADNRHFDLGRHTRHAGEAQTHGGKLFVGCLPYSRSSNDLSELFSKYGPLIEVALLTTPEGKSKGAAFVTFVNKEDAEKALIELQGYTFPNSSRGINISFATRQSRPTPSTTHALSPTPRSNAPVIHSFDEGSPPGFASPKYVYDSPAQQFVQQQIDNRNVSNRFSTPSNESPYSILRSNSEVHRDLERINEALIKDLFGDETLGFPPLK